MSMKHGVWLAIVPALLLGGPVRGQQTFQLRLKPRGQGCESTLDFSSRLRLALTKYDSLGQQTADDLNVRKSRMTCTTTTLEMNGEQNVRERRVYSRAVSSINGGDEQPEPFQGKTLLFIVKDGTSRVLTESGAPLAEDLVARLERQSSQWNSMTPRYEDMLPARPVQVGESWPIDAASWVKRSDVELQVVRASSQLMQVYRKQNRLYGIIETRVEIAMKTMTVSGRKLTMQPGSRITAHTITDVCIDGTSTECVERGTYLFNGIVRAPGPDGVDTKMDQEIEVTHVQTTK
jgi:hypothetical protein